MNLEKEHKSPMEVLAAFIVDKRNLIFFFYICAMIFSVFSQGWVHVENDITAYLPEDKLLHQLPAAGAERFPQIIAGMLGYVRGRKIQRLQLPAHLTDHIALQIKNADLCALRSTINSDYIFHGLYQSPLFPCARSGPTASDSRRPR